MTKPGPCEQCGRPRYVASSIHASSGTLRYRRMCAACIREADEEARWAVIGS